MPAVGAGQCPPPWLPLSKNSEPWSQSARNALLLQLQLEPRGAAPCKAKEEAMFCDRCGTRVQDHDRACFCGRVFPDEARLRLVHRVEWLGLSWCAMADLQIIAAAVFLSRFAPGEYSVSASTVQMVAVLLAIFGFAAFAAGIGLHSRESWARPLALVLALPALAEFPVGTVLGICTLRTLIPRRAGTENRTLSAIWT